MSIAPIYAGQVDAGELPDATRARTWWFWGPLVVFGLVVPLAIAALTPIEYWGGLALSYINVLIGGGAMVYAAKRRTLGSMFILLALPLQILAFPVTSIYFAITNPDAEVTSVLSTPFPILAKNVRTQLSVMVFYLGFLPPLLWVNRHRGDFVSRLAAVPHTTRKWTGAAIAVWMVFMLPVFLSGFSSIPVIGLHKYSVGMILFVGVAWTLAGRWTRRLGLTILAGFLFLGILAGARGLGGRPAVLVLLALFFLSHLKPRTKFLLLLTASIGFPAFMFVGHATRSILGAKGNIDASVSRRASAVAEQAAAFNMKDSLDGTFGRFLFTGGKSILSKTPERIPYLDFSLIRYLRELGEMMLPQRLIFRPHYSSSVILIRYDHLVGPAFPDNAVEVSLIGSSYVLGGYVPVFVIALATGLIYVLVILLLRRMQDTRPTKALFFFAILSPLILHTATFDFIQNTRNLLWKLAFAWIGYSMLRIFVGDEQGEVTLDPSAPYSTGGGGSWPVVR